MPRRRTPRRLHRLVVGCVVLFVALTAAGFFVVELDRAQHEADDDQLVFAEAATLRARLEDELYGSLNLAGGLRAYAASHPDLDDPERLELLLATLYDQGEHLRNVGIAPGNVLRVVHPLEGNEAALGLRYEDSPTQWPGVRQAMITGSPVLVGPVDLVQGGRGLINRTPVYLGRGEYWGVVSLVIDVDSALDAVREDTTLTTPIAWAVRTWTNYGDATPLTGDQGLFDDPDVRLTFDVPNGTWEVAASALGSGGVGRRAAILRIVAVVFAAVLTVLVFEVVRERWRVLSLSLHDPLTGLPNRRLLDERIERAVAWSGRRDTPFVLAFVDLDRFKQVNDTYGHRAGDQVLREVASRLEGRVRSTDTVARVGGDEFVVLLPEADPSRAEALAAELERAVGAPIHWDGHEVEVGASTGIAVYPRDGVDATALVQRADGGMYRAKQARRDEVLPRV